MTHTLFDIPTLVLTFYNIIESASNIFDYYLNFELKNGYVIKANLVTLSRSQKYLGTGFNLKPGHGSFNGTSQDET